MKPVCQHLRVVPDYCSFRGLLAVGGNETTPNNDANAVVGQPQSGIWFGKTDDLWSWGKPHGWGGPWRNDAVTAGTPSDPFLFTDFQRKMLHLVSEKSGIVDSEIDFLGNGTWVKYETVRLIGRQYHPRHLSRCVQRALGSLDPRCFCPDDCGVHVHLGTRQQPQGAFVAHRISNA